MLIGGTQRSSHGVGSQEVLQASLGGAGNYSIQWSYHGWAENQVDQSSCDIMFIEWAILPSATFNDVMNSLDCPNDNHLPSQQLFQGYSTEEVYVSSYPFNLQSIILIQEQPGITSTMMTTSFVRIRLPMTRSSFL